MRNLILAGATGLVLALTATSAFAIPSTDQIERQGQSQDQSAVGAFLPLPVQTGVTGDYWPAAPRSFGGEGSNTGAGVGGSSTHR